MISKNEIKYIQSLFQKKTEYAWTFIAEAVKPRWWTGCSVIFYSKIYATDEWVKSHPSVSDVVLVESFELEKSVHW